MPRNTKVLLLQLPHPLYPRANLPLAAGYLKAAVHAHELKEFDVEILNTTLSHFDQLGDGSIVAKILEKKPDILGITMFLWNSVRSFELCKRIKQFMPNTILVAGGPEVSPQSLGTIFRQGVDFAVWGMGEMAFLDILKMVRHRERVFWKIPGVYSAPSGNVVGNGKALVPDYASLPSPYVLGYFDLERYSTLPIFTTQGCLFNCKYCSWGGRGPLKGFSLGRLIDELNMFKALDNISIYIMDSSFNDSPIFTEICNEIANNNLTDRRRVECFADASRITPDQVKVLSMARITNVEVGVQSLNPSALSAIGRRADCEKLLSNIEYLSASGVSTCVDIILGLPGDNLGGFQDTMRRLEGFNVGKHIFNLSISPATKLRIESNRWGLKYQEEPPYYVLGTSLFPENDIETAFLKYSDYSSDYEDGYADLLYYPQSIRLEGTIPRIPITKADIQCVQTIWFEGNASVRAALDAISKGSTKIANIASHQVSIVFIDVNQDLALSAASELFRLILTKDSYASIDFVLEFPSVKDVTSVKDLLAFGALIEDRRRGFLDYRNHFLALARKTIRSGSVNLILVFPPDFALPKELGNALRILWVVDIDSAICPEATIPEACLAQSNFILVDNNHQLAGGGLLSAMKKISRNISRYRVYFKDWGVQSLFDASFRYKDSPLSVHQEVLVDGSGELWFSEYSNIDMVRQLLGR